MNLKKALERFGEDYMTGIEYPGFFVEHIYKKGCMIIDQEEWLKYHPKEEDVDIK